MGTAARIPLSRSADFAPAPDVPGAVWQGDRCHFRVWAPAAESVEIRVVAPQPRTLVVNKTGAGYFTATFTDAVPGTRYFYRLNGGSEFPDPASRYQPEGVHGPSEVIDPEFAWTDRDWRGIPLPELVIYELHVGTFSREGTFDAAIAQLNRLRDLGITAIEIMPVAQFPGCRNWGYDGVYPYAVQNSYGGPNGLKRFVDACHQRGLAVILDVVYNHLGPEGNYLSQFGPYFTGKYQTPWGSAINFDDAHNGPVREFFLQNALYWITDFHLDALRLDAIHGIYDFSAQPFLAKLAGAVSRRGAELDRRVHVIAESDLNDIRVVQPRALGGFGLDAQWNDDFHHALHVALTGERSGYYADFGGIQHLAKAYAEGFVYSGEYSEFRRREHGRPAAHIEPYRFVVFAQNHDQAGNRPLGERLSALVDFERLKLAAAAVITSPYLPLLFMGEEYGETAPFQYFVDHSDPGLIEAVRAGRSQEFAAFEALGTCPDAHGEATFAASQLNYALRNHPRHAALEAFYRELLRLRRELPALRPLSRDTIRAGVAGEPLLFLLRSTGTDRVLVLLNFGGGVTRFSHPLPAGQWAKLLDSADQKWHGPGSPAPEICDSTGSADFPLAASSACIYRLFSTP